MALLKISLWVTGIACLLAAPGIFVPVSTWQTVAEYFGVETLPDSPLFVYMVRLMCATYAGIGIYFIILGLRPAKHGLLVPYSGLVCVLLGVFCWITGKETAMPPKWFMTDSLSALILGVLIVLFWLVAKKPKAKSV
jgi:hypothetical protein